MSLLFLSRKTDPDRHDIAMSTGSLVRCDSCNPSSKNPRTAFCHSCGAVFYIATSSAEGTVCVCCGSSSVDVFPEETVTCVDCMVKMVLADPQMDDQNNAEMERMKMLTVTLAATPSESHDSQVRGGSLPGAGEGLKNSSPEAAASVEPRCATCGASGGDNFLPMADNGGPDCHIAHCAGCRVKFCVLDDYATCPTCGELAEELETHTKYQPMRTRVCRRCVTLVTTSDPEPSSTSGQSGTVSATAEPKYWMQNYSEELWRFAGCICGNQEPDCFDLQHSDHPTKSFYCLDCQQSYSEFVWDREVPDCRRQCPRSESHARIETDSIATGDEIIVCLKCEGRVAKRRFDVEFSDIRQEVENELAQSPDRKPDGNMGPCLHCKKEGVEIAATWHNGDVCLMRICDACGSADFLAEWDARGNAEPETLEGILEPETPEGFEELAHCCGSLTSLHPVENDADDVLLTCSRCVDKNSLICLTTCADPRIPKTVSGLRRTLQGTFSSGEMGLPYRTVKVQRLKDLKPGDQLEFQHTLYSHHAILVETLPNSDQLAVIEYTGQSDTPTVLAWLQSAHGKGHVARTLLKFRDIEKSLHRIDYHSLDCFLPSVAIRRAETRLREAEYNVGRSNCEHFCNWAKADLIVSRQVDKFKEKLKKVLQNPIWDFAGGAAKNALQLVSKKAVGIVGGVVEDVRTELLRLVNIKEGASRHILRTILRLGLKWCIRGLPFVISMLLRLPLPPAVLLALDANCMKPLAEAVANRLLPIEGRKRLDKG